MHYLLVILAIMLVPPRAFAAEPLDAKVCARVAFLGSSTTDGDTYPQLVRTALEDAGVRPVRVINAGVGGHRADQFLARLQRDVLDRHPTLVIIQSGRNDASHNVAPEEFEHTIVQILDALAERNIPVIVMTPQMSLGKVREKSQETIEAYEKILRRLVLARGLLLAESGARQLAAHEAGVNQVDTDDLHPSYEGQRTIAGAVLEAMGYPQAVVPKRPRNAIVPGVLRAWRLRELDKGEKIDPLNVAMNDAPIRVEIPESEPVEQLWLDDLRGFGMSVQLRDKLRPGARLIGITQVESAGEKERIFTLGGDVSAVWINGKEAWHQKEFRGFHIGSESFAGRLANGDNVIVIETGPAFFLSITDCRLDELGE